MKYEVIKLKNGSEICGMIKDMDEWIEITLPMICQLTKLGAMETLATFIPYAPLSRDATLTLARQDVMHRSNLNEQFIPFYDEASSRWLTMVENEAIPLTNKMPPREVLSRTIGDMLEPIKKILKKKPEMLEEQIRDQAPQNLETEEEKNEKV